ncbi:MAG: hypothetical protein MZV63_03460 [Marinilabiliales bacterium]|nr:hypothetical protein [Marinilabiliales bacterium]
MRGPTAGSAYATTFGATGQRLRLGYRAHHRLPGFRSGKLRQPERLRPDRQGLRRPRGRSRGLRGESQRVRHPRRFLGMRNLPGQYRGRRHRADQQASPHGHNPAGRRDVKSRRKGCALCETADQRGEHRPPPTRPRSHRRTHAWDRVRRIGPHFGHRGQSPGRIPFGSARALGGAGILSGVHRRRAHPGKAGEIPGSREADLHIVRRYEDSLKAVGGDMQEGNDTGQRVTGITTLRKNPWAASSTKADIRCQPPSTTTAKR